MDRRVEGSYNRVDIKSTSNREEKIQEISIESGC
jgi:hypothetical protein